MERKFAMILMFLDWKLGVRLILEYSIWDQKWAPKVGLRLIHEGGLYPGKYGNTEIVNFDPKKWF